MFWAVAYTVLTGICLAFAFGEARQTRPQARLGVVLLLILGAILLLFALEQAFGLLGTEVTGTARQTARAGGWYGQRRDLQKAVVGVILPCGAACFALLLWLTRRAGSRYLPLAVALVYLICFGALQAVSLHQWDARLRQRYVGVTFRTWGNIVGLGAACLALVPLTGRTRRKSTL